LTTRPFAQEECVKHGLRLAGLALIIGLLGACSTSEVPTVGPAETTVPQDVVETSEDMVDAPLDDMTMEFSNVPDGWPADIPVPAGGVLEAWTQPSDDQISASWRVEQVDTTGVDFVYDNLLMDASSAYHEAMRQLDWSESEHFATEESGEGNYIAQTRTVKVTVTPTQDGAVSFFVEYVALPEGNQ
jgi:hypothetical protein